MKKYKTRYKLIFRINEMKGNEYDTTDIVLADTTEETLIDDLISKYGIVLEKPIHDPKYVYHYYFTVEIYQAKDFANENKIKEIVEYLTQLEQFKEAYDIFFKEILFEETSIISLAYRNNGD